MVASTFQTKISKYSTQPFLLLSIYKHTSTVESPCLAGYCYFDIHNTGIIKTKPGINFDYDKYNT